MSAGQRLLAPLWHRLAGPLQWAVLWLSQAKFMVGVTGVVFDGEGRVLLLRHRFWPEGSWGLPGGYAHRGEELEAALARELREETGAAAGALLVVGDEVGARPVPLGEVGQVRREDDAVGQRDGAQAERREQVRELRVPHGAIMGGARGRLC